MCTVSWAKRPNGYTLFFNRDESRERPDGLPPEVSASNNVQFVCPRDPVGGGTWLLVNEYGLTLGLLNYYEAQVDYQPQDPKSRGDLPIRLAESKSLKEVESSLHETDLTPYPPFHLLAVARDSTASMITWGGTSTAIHHPGLDDLPISTSSFETSDVLQARRALFRENTLPYLDSDDALKRFHSSKEPAPDTYAVLMTRDIAKTVSVTQVNVSENRASLIYRSRPDDSDRLEPRIETSIDLV